MGSTDIARRLRRDQTEEEKQLWRALRAGRFAGFKFRRQHPIAGYIVDFVCLQESLIVELDGGQHIEQEEKDSKRTHALETAGYRVLRFWNNDVLTNSRAVLDAIYRELGCPSP